MNTKDGEGSSKAFDKEKIKCFHCKQHDHLIKDCKKRIIEEKTSPRKQSNIVTKVHKLYVASLLVEDELGSTCLSILVPHNTCIFIGIVSTLIKRLTVNKMCTLETTPLIIYWGKERYNQASKWTEKRNSRCAICT